jgi:hypothetical protein
MHPNEWQHLLNWNMKWLALSGVFPEPEIPPPCFSPIQSLPLPSIYGAIPPSGGNWLKRESGANLELFPQL